MKVRRAPAAPDQCDHFTGCFSGKCKAGVSYDSVRDQDRRDQVARFPCARSHSSFTTCAKAQFTPITRPRRRIDLSDKNRHREVIFEQPVDGRTTKVRGTLDGWSLDGESVFIRIRVKSRSQVVKAPTASCYLARRVEESSGVKHGGELPLFEAGVVESRGTVETLHAQPGRRGRVARARKELSEDKAA